MRASPEAMGPPARKSELRAWRREQLLEAAGRVLVDRGRAGFTMEAIAAAAGVSKALPYRHFGNSDAALAELFRRELGELLDRLSRAAERSTDGDGALEAVVHEYFEAVADRGALLALLAGTGSDVPELTGADSRRPPAFLVTLLRDHFRLGPKEATTLASVLVGTVIAGSDSMGPSPADRKRTESLVTSAVLGAVHAVADSKTKLR